MSRRAKHCFNPYSRRILCQRCHKSPAEFSLLGAIRLCSKCKDKTFPSLHPSNLHPTMSDILQKWLSWADKANSQLLVHDDYSI